MIIPLSLSYLELAKKLAEAKQNRIPTTPIAIKNWIKQKAREEFERSLKEAQTKEDEDIAIVPALPEDCPRCADELEIIAWIEKEEISRIIKFINVHCSGTHIRATVSGMRAHWRKLGWINDGYNIVVHYDGSVTILAPLNNVTNGVRGVNPSSINICTVGGVNDQGKTENTLSEAQRRIMHVIIKALRAKKECSRSKIKGHRDHPNVRKACPVYDAMLEYQY